MEAGVGIEPAYTALQSPELQESVINQGVHTRHCWHSGHFLRMMKPALHRTKDSTKMGTADTDEYYKGLLDVSQQCLEQCIRERNKARQLLGAAEVARYQLQEQLSEVLQELARINVENAALRHDVERHVAIASSLATAPAVASGARVGISPGNSSNRRGVQI